MTKLNTLPDDVLTMILGNLCTNIVEKLEAEKWMSPESDSFATQVGEYVNLQLTCRSFQVILAHNVFVKEIKVGERILGIQMRRVSLVLLVAKVFFVFNVCTVRILKHFCGAFWYNQWFRSSLRLGFAREFVRNQQLLVLGVRAKIFILAPIIWSQHIQPTSIPHRNPIGNSLVSQFNKRLITIGKRCSYATFRVGNYEIPASWIPSHPDLEAQHGWRGVSVVSYTIVDEHLFCRQQVEKSLIVGNEEANSGGGLGRFWLWYRENFISLQEKDRKIGWILVDYLERMVYFHGARRWIKWVDLKDYEDQCSLYCDAEHSCNCYPIKSGYDSDDTDTDVSD
jgi:hypothetical protein